MTLVAVAVLRPRSREHIRTAVLSWRDRCLLDDGSLLFPEDGALWTEENLGRIYHNIREDPLTDERTFIKKLKVQLGNDKPLVRLGAEANIIYSLSAGRGAVPPATKRARIDQILGWA